MDGSLPNMFACMVVVRMYNLKFSHFKDYVAVFVKNANLSNKSTTFILFMIFFPLFYRLH